VYPLRRYASDSEEDMEMDDDLRAEINLNDEEGWGRREDAWKRRVKLVVEGGLTVVLIGWMCGWAMLALLRSS
jgi:hypothetical protein